MHKHEEEIYDQKIHLFEVKVHYSLQTLKEKPLILYQL